MDTASPSDGLIPSVGTIEDTDILTAVEEEFECLYDVPYVTVNKIDGEIQAEVIFSGNEVVDLDRIRTALSVGAEHGYRAYARVFGTYHNVLILFSDSPATGAIYGPSDLLLR